MSEQRTLAKTTEENPRCRLATCATFSGERPIPTPDYQLEAMDGEILLFHPASLTIIHSNASGALIWQLCDGQRTVADIISLLQAAYPESAAVIEADVAETLQTWRQHGAIQWQ